MVWTTTHTTTFEGKELELELEVAPAEHDVGIRGPFIDNWSVIAVNGNTNQEACLEMEQLILLGDDDAFVERLYEEGAVDD